MYANVSSEMKVCVCLYAWVVCRLSSSHLSSQSQADWMYANVSNEMRICVCLYAWLVGSLSSSRLSSQRRPSHRPTGCRPCVSKVEVRSSRLMLLYISVIVVICIFL